jgi:hypothetical protein
MRQELIREDKERRGTIIIKKYRQGVTRMDKKDKDLTRNCWIANDCRQYGFIHARNVLKKISILRHESDSDR